MKCVRCGEDSKKKDRSGRVCPKCAGRFAFEPTEGDPVTDGAFQHAIEAVSAKGTVRFHRRHVHYQLCRQLAPGAASAFFGSLTDTLFGWLSPPKPKISVAPLSPESFETLWKLWVAAHGRPKGVVEEGTRAARPRSAELEAELESYSFDRAVICDQPGLVDVLVANRFHFENNCAILSIDGHPADAFETVRKMLRKNPKLVVVAVHDASVPGCTLATRLATDPEWFAGQARVVDVGLRPEHAALFPRQAHAVTGVRGPPPPGVSAKEWAWLQAGRLSAFAIRPEQLVKRLYKAIVEAESGAPASGDAGASGGDAGIGDGVVMYGGFGGDATSADGGGDSFG